MAVLLNTNIRGGFCANIDELSCFFSQLFVDVAIALLSEIWLHAGISEELKQNTHFITYRNDPSDGKQSG